MKVILNQDVDNLGKIGQIVNVKDGYARNFLIPREMALPADEKNKASLAHQLKTIEKRKATLLVSAKELAAKIEKVSVTVSKQVGEDEKIFGSVTTGELEGLLAQEGLRISKKDIVLSEEIKKVGVYSAKVKLHSDVQAQFKVWVVAQ
jgi:large subunit ribosomal protein L9